MPNLTRPISQILRYLLSLLKEHRLQATLNTLFGVLLVVLDLSFVWVTKLAVDIATHHAAKGQTLTLTHAFALMVAIMVARIVISVASRWVRAILGVRAQNSMRRHIFERLLRSQWEALRTYHTGNLTNRIERDVTDVVAFTTETLPSFVTTFLQFLGAFLFLFFMDSTLACIVVVIVPFFLLSSKLYVKKMRKLTHEVRDDETRIQSTIQETLQHAMVVKTLERVDYFLSRLGGEQHTLHRRVLERTRYSATSAAIMSIGFAAGFFVTFAWGTISLQKGLISYGALLAFIQLVGQIQTPVRNLSRFIPVFISSFTATERIMDLEEIALEPQKPSQQLASPVGIEFRNVTFAYTPQSRKIFENFSFTFPAGQITAIVGETGAGKTTLIRLLFSLVTPQAGTILLHEQETGRDYVSEPSLRGNFAYVPQGNTLFSGTIRSNLLLGNPKADDAMLQKALHTAAADFVFRKPEGLDSPCGEAGNGLSEGQAQRIAIARALLCNGNILVFDEATSSLDAATERTVLQNIIEAYPHFTIIFITHRTEVLKYAAQTLCI